MSLYEDLQGEMKNAMKSGDKDSLSTYRMLVSSINYASIDNHNDKSDKLVLDVLTKEAKKRRESIQAYNDAGREELAQKEESELAIIEGYLPKMLTEEEVEKVVRDLIEGKDIDFGSAMRMCMEELKGRADGKIVSSIVARVMGQK